LMSSRNGRPETAHPANRSRFPRVPERGSPGRLSQRRPTTLLSAYRRLDVHPTMVRRPDRKANP
jgi:hypothetical protein